MSHENMIENFLRETGVAANTLATLSGINRTHISFCLNGKASFNGPEALLLCGLIQELRDIREDLQPVPVNWSDCATIRKLLECRRGGVAWKVVAQVQPEPEDQNEQQ